MDELVKIDKGQQLESAIAREVQQVQAQAMLAKKFPRNSQKCFDKIKTTCAKSKLAEVAIYYYPEGGQTVYGASIRLAEAIAQIWGNVEYGVREIERGEKESVVESYAWDLETNTRVSKIFSVKHERYSKGKGYFAVTDGREIYEIVANNASRRVRACILSIIPAEIVEMAMSQVALTQKASCDTSPEGIRLIVSAYEEFGVTIQQLSEFIGKPLDLIEPAEVMRLKRVYVSIRDGFGFVQDYFSMRKKEEEEEEEPEEPEEKKKPLNRKKKGKEQEGEDSHTQDSVSEEEDPPPIPEFVGGKK